jgi:hypothetical protein
MYRSVAVGRYEIQKKSVSSYRVMAGETLTGLCSVYSLARRSDWLHPKVVVTLANIVQWRYFTPIRGLTL